MGTQMSDSKQRLGWRDGGQGSFLSENNVLAEI